MQPEAGVRFELKRAEVDGVGARYLIALALPQSSFSGDAQIATATGDIVFDWRGAAPPAWCTAVVRAQLRTVWRERGASAAYPRRLARWRPIPPEAPSSC